MRACSGLIVLLTFPPMLGACGAGERGGDPATVRDSAGIVVVENHRPQWREGQEWRLSAEPRVAIGVVDGDAEYQFSRVTAAQLLSDGRIVVVDGQAAEVRVFRSDGRYLQTLGRRGQGPGEFRYPFQLEVARGDTLVVWDAPFGPASRFDPEGGYVDRHAPDRGRMVELLGPGSMSEGFVPLPDGSMVLTVYERQSGPPPTGQLFRPRLAYVRADPELSRVDSLGSYGGFAHMMVSTGGPQPMPAVMFFSPSSHLGVGGDPVRIYTGDSETFEIRGFDGEGRLERIIRRSGPRREVDAANLNHARETSLERAERNDRRAQIERAFAALPPTTHFPAFAALHVDAGGHLWVQEYRAPLDEVARWTVFDPDGRMLGTVDFPRPLRVTDIGDAYVLGIWRDDLEVEHVLLYDLAR